MIDRSLFNVEDFLVDNTFQLYCAGTDKLCVAYWERYINEHPEQERVIKEARRLYIILSGNKKPVNQGLESLKKSINSAGEVPVLPIRRNYNWLSIAAAVLVVTGVFLFYQNGSKEKESKRTMVTLFSTKGGERKKITLSDGSIVMLNAKSSLRIATDFNCSRRE